MRGTFEDPPIIIEQDGGKVAALLVVIVALFLVLGLLAWADVEGDIGWAAYATVALFGILILLGIGLLIRPGRLIVDRDGLTLCTALRTLRYSWNDIAKFVTYSSNGFASQAAFILAEGSTRHRFSRRLTGGLGTLGNCWEFSPLEVVDILNDAQARWGERPAIGPT